MFSLSFLGVSLPGSALGSNDTSSVLGPALGSKMHSFRPLAIVCALSFLAGALTSGTAPTQTLGLLGPVIRPLQAWAIAWGVAVSIGIMTRLRLPASTVQAMAGALLGWQCAMGVPLPGSAITQLTLAWAACPLLSAILAVLLYKLTAKSIASLHINIFRLDRMVRVGIFLACGFAGYALGANNVAGVAGPFLTISPFHHITFLGVLPVTAAQQLYGITGLMTMAGILLWARPMAEATGNGIFKFSSVPLMALIAIVTQGLVLLLFSDHGPAMGIPAVPISGFQSLAGATVGLSLVKKGGPLRLNGILSVAAAWMTTPLLAATLTAVVGMIFG